MLVLIPLFALLSSLLSSLAPFAHREPSETRAYHHRHHHHYVRQTSVVYVRQHPPVIYQRPAAYNGRAMFVRPAPYTTAVYYYR